MASHAIEVKNLYKIFGPNGGAYVDAVKKGLGKAELNEKHGHVLGLQNINISMPAGGVMVVMGLSGSGKSTLIRHINRLIDPTAGEVLYDDSRLFHDKLTALGIASELSAIDGMEHVAVVRALDMPGAPETFTAVANFIDRILES